MIVSDIGDALQGFLKEKGLRNILWLLLVLGMCLLVFESKTQYFTFTSIHARASLLGSIAQVSTDGAARSQIVERQRILIEEYRSSEASLANPGTYLLQKIVRFIQGSYLSLPLFYLVGKLFTFLFRALKEEKQRLLVVIIGSLLVSLTVWFATLLGVISVIWNTSDSLIQAWLVFPMTSFIIFIFFAIWLGLLRMMMPEPTKKSRRQVADS
jgi:hypothetical protein